MLSKKKAFEITSILNSEASKILEKLDTYHTEWYNSPPDTWNKEETLLFDTVYEMVDSMSSKILQLFNKTK